MKYITQPIDNCWVTQRTHEVLGFERMPNGDIHVLLLVGEDKHEDDEDFYESTHLQFVTFLPGQTVESYKQPLPVETYLGRVGAVLIFEG